MAAEGAKKPTGDARRGKRRRPRRRTGQGQKGPAKPKPTKLPDSVVDRSRPADEPLTRAEMADMRRHLAFIRRYRSVLRLKLNATEDLLVNGTKQTDHRGTCKHLLSKIDQSSITAALGREPLHSDVKSRVDFLGGAAAITGDLRVLFQFLEAMGQTGASQDAARAFTLAVQDIDFASVTSARLNQLLEVMQAVFDEHEVTGTLFGLLQGRGFRQAFDANAESLKPELTARFVPLRAVFEAISARTKSRSRRGGQQRESSEALSEGLRLMLSAPPGVIGAYPEAVRISLLGSAIATGAPWVATTGGVLDLLRSLPVDSNEYRSLGSSYAKLLLASGAYKQALSALLELQKIKKPPKEVKELTVRLRAPRIAHFSLQSKKPVDGLQLAFSLRDVEPVLVRFARPGSKEQVENEVRIQADICLPGVLDVLEHGVSDTGQSYVAVPVAGERLDWALESQDRAASREVTVDLAVEGIRLFRALGLARVTLPDVATSRFVLDRPDRLLLADFTGARTTSETEAAEAARRSAADWCRSALVFPPFKGKELRRDLPGSVKRALTAAFEEPSEAAELVRILRGL